MDDEEKIFGPLNLKQFIRVAGAFGLGYFSYRFMPLQVSIPLIVVAAVILFSAFVNQTPVVFNEEFIKRKRYSFKNLEDFQKWLNRKIAEIESQIYQRKNRGLVPDPSLEKALEITKRLLKEIK
jgi:hypothetical protein